jgi:predicted PurR-regulated permease PerM
MYVYFSMNVFSPTQRFLITWLLLLVTGWLTVGVLNYVAELISILVTAGLIAFLLNYPVARLQKFIPRGLAAGVVYLIAALVVTLIVLIVIPPIWTQASQFAVKLPDLLQSGKTQLTEFQIWSKERNLPFNVPILQQQLFEKIQGQVQAIAAQGIGIVLGTFNWFVDLIFIVVISFYMLLDGVKIWEGITSFFAPEVRYVFRDTLQRNLQKFVVGQFVLGLFMAGTLSIAFWWLKVPYFLLFAVFIGILEILPFIGATLGIGAVTVIVLFINGWLALEVLAISVTIQQIKDNAIAPKVLGDLTGLSPVIVFAALLLGGKVAGLLGVILAIPLTGVIKSIVEIALDPTLPPQTGSFFYNPFYDTLTEDTPRENPPSINL